MMSTHKHNKHKNKTDEEICTLLQIKMWTCGYMINGKPTSLAAIMRIIASSTIIDDDLAIIISQALKQLYVACNKSILLQTENFRVNPVDKHHTSLKD